MEKENRKTLYYIIAYTIIMSLLAALVFGGIVTAIPDYDPEITSLNDSKVREIFVLTVIVMFAAGVIGGCLYNYRGIIKHTAEGTYDSKYTITYVLRPISGGISGLVVFFILLGGALALTIGADGSSRGWLTFTGRMPYIAFAIIAGFASQEFMMKLKDLANSFFAVKGENTGSAGE
jgi:hypothetical protein